MKTNKFEKRVQDLFPKLELSQYRESNSKKGNFVEFTYHDPDSPNTYTDLKTLLKLKKLLKTDNIQVTGFDIGNCHDCSPEHVMYVVAYGVF